MNNHILNNDTRLPKNGSRQRVYQRRNRKGNRTTLFPLPALTLTSTIVTGNTTQFINSTSVPITDLFASISSNFTEYKYLFLIGICLLVLLCCLTVIFLLVILRCAKRKTWDKRRQERIDKQRLRDLPDFLDDPSRPEGEQSKLLESIGGTSTARNGSIMTNGNLPNDNISNTLSLDPMLEQKIIKHNSIISPSAADDTSLDTLRGSLISSPSQPSSVVQPVSTPTRQLSTTTTTDSTIKLESRPIDDEEKEKDDDFHDLDLKPIAPRFVKAANISGSNLATHRTSGSSIEQSIGRQERRAEEKERSLLHGSNSNIYEKELRRHDEQAAFARKQHTNSQVSLVSRTSEDSCY